MFLTTRELFETLQKHHKLPKESQDPIYVMQQNFRYFKFYQVLDMGQPSMSQIKFINSFFKLYTDQYRYNIAKAQKKHYMKQIENSLDQKIEYDSKNKFTRSELREKIDAIKLRIK